MKKVLCALAIVLAVAGCSFAAHRVGMLERLNISPEKLAELVNNETSSFSHNSQKQTILYYRSLNEMVLALSAGEVDEIALPEAAADYILRTNPEYFINCVFILKNAQITLAFGFNADRKDLAESFNKALRELKQDGTLVSLQSRHINPIAVMVGDMNIAAPTPSVFRKFEGAPTIKVAVTGDLPPIDYIAADGSPEGFNVAILAEICARLGLNVELLSIESGARAAALASGRADAVFWFEHHSDLAVQPDVPEGVILSEPYYSFNTYYHLMRAAQ